MKGFQFQVPKKKPPDKIKMMLWIKKDLLNRIECLRPHNITLQECMRQILENYVEYMEEHSEY